MIIIMNIYMQYVSYLYTEWNVIYLLCLHLHVQKSFSTRSTNWILENGALLIPFSPLHIFSMFMIMYDLPYN